VLFLDDVHGDAEKAGAAMNDLGRGGQLSLGGGPQVRDVEVGRDGDQRIVEQAVDGDARSAVGQGGDQSTVRDPITVEDVR
jgi:hypothetical protein